MRSDAEILAIVCRTVSSRTVGNPVVVAETQFSDLKWLYKPQEHFSEETNKAVEIKLKRRSTVNNLMWDIIPEFSDDLKHLWIYPEYFSWRGTYKKIKTIADMCKLIKDGYDRSKKDSEEENLRKNKKEALVQKLKNVTLLDVEDILHSSPSWEEVQKFFLEGEFGDEPYLVKAIKIHLLTENQKKIFVKHDITIEDALNGRNGGKSVDAVYKIFNKWNEKLGFHDFGS